MYRDKIRLVPNGTYALVAQLDRVTDYESVGRGFESLPSHQEKTSTRCVLVFLFVCTMEGARTGRRRIAPQAISPVGCCLELRVAAPSIRLVPWVALASCWPLPQQLLLASATGRSRRCCRSQWLGMSTVEAVDRKISWLFCFVSHGCTVSARFLHGRCFPCPIM